MKKFVSVLMVVMLLAGLSLTAFAAYGTDNVVVKGLPDSPQMAPPTVLDGPRDANGELILYLTSELNEDMRIAIQDLKSDDFQESDVARELDKAAKGDQANPKDVDAEIIQVFRVCTTKPDEVTEGNITIQIPNDFVALIVATFGYDEDNNKIVEKWDVMKTNKVEGGSDRVQIHVVVDQVIALVVSTPHVESPNTGENIPYAYLIAAVVLAAGAALFFYKSRKAEA